MKDSTLNFIGKTGSLVIVGATILLCLYALAIGITDLGTAFVCVVAVLTFLAIGWGMCE